jgi:hypothetical protein
MAMTNYRDLSTARGDPKPGFQFEFFCEVSEETWRSPFVPYRRGQMHGLMSRLTYWFNELHSASRMTEYMSDSGVEKSKAAALDEAQAMAAKRFTQCEGCGKWVINTQLDERTGRCSKCARRGASGGGFGQAYSDNRDEGGGAAAAVVCPNCQTPSEGGRFCHECGFDMASAFKSCPGCGTTLPRQARFCTDCGHGF